MNPASKPSKPLHNHCMLIGNHTRKIKAAKEENKG